MANEKRWDVAIVRLDTSLIESVIGKNLNTRQAERRVLTGLSRINDRYFVSEYPTCEATEGDKLPEGRI